MNRKTKKMSEETKIAPEKVEPSDSSAAMLSAFKEELATTVNSVYVNSLKREFQFKEVSVKE